MRMTTRVCFGGSVGALALVLMTSVGNAASVPPGMRSARLAGAPAGLVAAISRSEQHEAALDPAYRMDAQGCARLAAQRMTACFSPDDAARFRIPHAALHLRLTAWGRSGRLTALALATDRPQANRVEYRGNGIRTWWQVLPLGYEQGFTVERAPAGHGPVVIELRASRTPAVRGDSLAWGTFHYGKLRVVDAAGRVLHAMLRAAGRRVFLRIDTAHARYPLNVDPLVWVEQEVTANNGAAGDDFGFSVALSGSTALVGAPNHSSQNGAAYVFTGGSGIWSQAAELSLIGAGAVRLGDCVALTGPNNIALVGAPFTTIGTQSRQGAVFVYTEPASGWATTSNYSTQLTASDGVAGDLFGRSVAASGSNALVGAPFHTVGVRSEQGDAYVFTDANGTWSQAAELTASDGLASNLLGSSVALDGTTAVVGANNVGSFALPAYVYVEPAGGWATTSSFSAELTASDEGGSDRFGASVAVSGPTVLVGAPAHTVGSNASQGAAYFFGSADLGLVLSTPAVVAPGANYSSQAILTNSSSTASPALSVSLPVPTGTNYVSSSATQGSCSQAAGTVTCNLGSLAASGGSTSGSVTLQATAAAGTALANSASLASSNQEILKK